MKLKNKKADFIINTIEEEKIPEIFQIVLVDVFSEEHTSSSLS